MIIVFKKTPYSKRLAIDTTTQNRRFHSSGLKSLLKFRCCGELEWTVGLTVELKLRLFFAKFLRRSVGGALNLL